jgi:streptomycin 6-kinase
VIDIPPVVRAKALAAGASAWLDGLAAVVADLERAWAIRVGRVFDGGTEALVAEAAFEDGTPAVLKLAPPHDLDAARLEIAVLGHCAGDGCVELLRDDVERGALLLERLGPSLHDLALPIGRRHEILCATAQRVWRPAPDTGLPTGRDKAEWLAVSVETWWEELGRPCRRAAVDHALACAGRRARAYDPARALLVHGDVHQWNALAAGDGFKLVDPDGLVAEPEYDLGIVMREDPVELLTGDPMDRARWLAARTGLDAEAIWEWGVVERVSTGLLGTRIGLQPVAAQMLRAAEVIARDA